MIRAIRQSGELWRPKKAGQNGVCDACGGLLVAEATRGHRAWQWKHVEPCKGPGDGWDDRMRELLGRCGYVVKDFWMEREKTCVVLSCGWWDLSPNPEQAIRSRGMFPIKLVDARAMSLDLVSSFPGCVCPSWLLGAAWSDFVKTWLTKPTAPVVLHLRNVVAGYPGDHENAVYFAVEHPFGSVVKPRGGPLRGVPSTGAMGRCTTLRDFVMIASRLESLQNKRVSWRYQNERASVYAPFSAAPTHTLDLPAWVGQDAQDRTYAAHQQRMAARRSSQAATTLGD